MNKTVDENGQRDLANLTDDELDQLRQALSAAERLGGDSAS